VTGEPNSDFKTAYESLAGSLTFQELIRRIESRVKSVTLSGLEGASKYFFVRTLQLATGRPLLFISPDGKKAQEASQDLSFFFGKAPPVLFKKEFESGKPLFASSRRFSSDLIGWLKRALDGPLVVAESCALLKKTIPKNVFEDSIIRIETGETLFREDLIGKLLRTGYKQTEFIEMEGEMSVRGSILDVFSPGAEIPVRIEFIGDEIGSLRRFNPNDQKSREKVSAVTILPGSEVIPDEDSDEDSVGATVDYIRKKAREDEVSARNKLALIEDIQSGERVPNIEWLLPAFYTQLSSPLDYLLDNALIITDDPELNENSLIDLTDSMPEIEKRLKRQMKVAPDTEELYLSREELEELLAKFQQLVMPGLQFSDADQNTFRFRGEPVMIDVAKKSGSPVKALTDEIDECREKGFSLHTVFKTKTEREKLMDLMPQKYAADMNSHVGNLSHGFKLAEAEIEVVTEWDLLGEKKERRSQQKRTDVPSAFITSFSELKHGDYIVHRDCGIGIFKGLKRLKIGKSQGDFIHCEYADGDKIYVPVDRLKLVQRYIGDGKPHKVDKLGHKNWNTRIRRVRKAVENVARELLELYARRKARKGYAFSPRDDMFRQFELSFTYEETPDQEAAIEEVIRDMETPRPMDRLICGDVGFGKTEVALRAAFKAVSDGKQVAFLVPTTLLAQQHHKTSVSRLKGYPVVVESLSRFKTGREASEITGKLEEGKIDIIIGTHKLLGKKIKFKDLGLIIIDEEHRFGVSQKEKLRKLKQGVDALSLSATPIPRTLQLSLAKIRDISLINTPPEGRQTIETYVYQSSPEIIKEAIKKEMERGGSVFFIHNRIEDIHRVADRIQTLHPEARIEITHGRMRERQLEKSISSFIEGDVDILVTTAIVESGIDIPRANTIIIDDAHTFGLADLYQLRGRVGRSDRKAYAYLLIPVRTSLSIDARRRLKAISEFRELGSGFKLALSDLEIRGAGNLFGVEQSGHIADVGLELYLDMLDGAVKRLEGTLEPEETDPDISVSSPAFIPDDYISNDSERLFYYKRLSAVNSDEEIATISAELRDRFGDIPEPVGALIELIELKVTMKKLGVEKAEFKRKRALIIFSDNSQFYDRFPPEGRVEIYTEAREPIDEARQFLENLIKRDKENRPKRSSQNTSF